MSLKLVSTTEVAKELDVSRQYVHQLIQARKLKATKIGRNYVVCESDLSKFKKKSSK